MAEHIDPDRLEQELKTIRRIRSHGGRGYRYRRSRLDNFEAELTALAEKGASWRDLALWLRQYKHTVVHPTTIGRRLKHWREKAESRHG